MIKRNIAQLAIYQIDREEDTIPLERLRNLYVEKTSEIIYIIKDKKLYGIVCMGEVLYGHKKNAEVKINKSFTFLSSFSLVKAGEIFRKHRKIHKVPVVNESGELLGDYSRWDDILYIERNQERIMQEEAVKQILEPYGAVYIVKPISSNNSVSIYLRKHLDHFGIKYEIICKEAVKEKLLEDAICIFITEDEKRGTLCLHGIEPQFYDKLGWDVCKYDVLADARYRARLTTYGNLIYHIVESKRLKLFNLKKPEHLLYEKLDIKSSVFFAELAEKGIKSFSLCSYEEEATEYGLKFTHDMYIRLNSLLEKAELPFSSAVDNEKFYAELLQIEDYQKGTAQKEISFAENAFEYKRNMVGKYFNAQDGRRVTCFQPEEYIGTIYLVGMCTVIGAFVEDQFTIASFLQRKLLENGFKYRVENYASMIRPDSALEKRLEEIKEYSHNDIIVYLSGFTRTVEVNGSLEKIFERNKIPSEWVKDGYTHCNHKANQVIAESMFEMIKSDLPEDNIKNEKEKMRIDISGMMRSYIQRSYLDQYFMNYSGERYNTVGAVVIEGSPFNSGHRYIIEYASQKVDFVIVFVLQEDTSLFPFEERFQMIKKGIEDIPNIMVVPNGDFVLSMNNFPDYYKQNYSLTTGMNAEYDVNIFVDYIAKPLHITHRFAGEGVQGRVNKTYYEAMRRILPANGIEFVEIPKMAVGGEKVCTKQIQQYLEDEQYDIAFAFVPESTKRYLMRQLALLE